MLSELLHHRNPFVRKASMAALRVPRWWRRRSASPADYVARPPIFANSFPKSGTHLLDQALSGLPHAENFGAFLASLTSSFQYRRRSDDDVRGRITAFVPGELVRGHLWRTEPAAKALREVNAAHYFIYRDPRDVVVSEAHYLQSANRWHKLHPYFARLKTVEEAIALSIRGLADELPTGDYEHIGRRFADYEGWVTDDNVCAVKFEDLRSASARSELHRMAAFYAARSTEPVNLAECVARMQANQAPHKSHTFRSGAAGGWKASFTPAHRELFKQLAGDLLIRLGYETSLDW